MVREIVGTLAALWTLSSAASANAQPPDPDRPRHKAALAALRYFESVQGAEFDALLRQLRRPAPPPAARARVIENLPTQGELSPTTEEVARLERIRSVLAVHEREHDLEVRLVEAGGLALVALHARTVLLITREALSLSTPEELLAIMAHEVGHDYLWDEYEAARRQGDPRRLQEVELLCDGIALITLDRLGLDPEHLVLAAMKLRRHNERVSDGPAFDAAYVPLDERVRFIRAVARLISGATAGRREILCRYPKVGVGMTITDHPLHRSGRAALPLPALALGGDGEAHARIGMTDPWGRKPAGEVGAHTAPRQMVALTPATQDAPPELRHRFPKQVKAGPFDGTP